MNIRQRPLIFDTNEVSHIFIEERHLAILDIIKENGRISIGDIQEMFDVSVDSARRDLRLLEEQGLLRRTHGGAIPLRQVSLAKPPKTTAKDITEIKGNDMAIAKTAVSEIRDNDVVFIISASIGYFMVQNIPSSKRLRVVTNSVVLAEDMRTKDNITVILLGGEMDQRGNCYDAFAVNMIRELRFDKCFLSATSISAEFGLSSQRSNVKPFYNAVISSSKKTYGLFPTEKIGFESSVNICPASRLSTLITDWNAPREELRKFGELGVEVVIAQKES